MAQQIINVGAAPNDGQGDPIRTSFIKCNNNFGELYSRTQTVPPVTLVGSVGDTAGMVAYDSQYYYYCFGDFDGSSIIWRQVPNALDAQVTDLQATGNIDVGGYTNVTGNVTAAYFIGNGAGLTGVTAGAPTSIANGTTQFVAESTGNAYIYFGPGGGTIARFGNALNSTTSFGFYTTGFISTTGNLQANLARILNNLSVENNLISNTLITANNITISGNVNSNLSVSNNVTVGGTLTLNGNILNDINTTSDITTTGNVSGSYIIGDGGFLSNVTAISNVAVSQIANGATSVAVASTNGNVNITVNGNSIGVITSTGANITGYANVVGNVDANNFNSSGRVTAVANVTGGNLVTGGSISAVGSITGASLSTGTGNLTGGNVNTAGLANVGQLAVTGTSSFTGNITGSITVAGNVNASNFVTSGDLSSGSLSATANINGGNLIVTGLVSAGTTITALGNVAGSNLTTGGRVVALGNVTGQNLTTSGRVDATGNVSGGNLEITSTATIVGNVVAGNIQTVGNITAGYFVGNGSQLTGLPPTYTNSNVVSLLAAFGSNTISTTGNITAGNLLIGGIVNNNANGVGNIGDSSGYFNTVFAKATSAQYADLAENYLADAEYSPGTVLKFGGSAEVTICDQDADPTIVGVVSTEPAVKMNSRLEGEHVVTIALAGRVPCQVVGKVWPGAMMVSAGNGHARAERSPAMGTVIGKALEAFDGEQGTIEVVVGRL